jgi:hypothetical protein
MNTTSSCCGGNSSSTSSCATSVVELPRYYPRQLITPDDLTLEQNYFRDRMRRHNRLLHGWGVVCGALVCPVKITNADGTISYAPWQVQVQPGYILGPYGDEILLDCIRTIDIRTPGVSGVSGEPCMDTPDPWCVEVFTPPSTTNQTTYYIAVKYVQSMTRPVRVQPTGCGCNDSSCEYSRWHDGYQIGVLDSCPDCNITDANTTPPKFTDLVTGSAATCPPCDCGPWVGLAVVTVNSDGSIAQIDNCSCRRHVLSFATFWWKCTTPTYSLTVTDLNKKNPAPIAVNTQDQNGVQLLVTATNVDADASFTFGDGVKITNISSSGTAPNLTFTMTATADSDATLGNKSLIAVNKDCGMAIAPNAINVTGQQTLASATPVVAGNSRTIVNRVKKPAKTSTPAG